MGCINSCFKPKSGQLLADQQLETESGNESFSPDSVHSSRKNIVIKKKLYSDSSSADDPYMSESSSLLGKEEIISDINSESESDRQSRSSNARSAHSSTKSSKSMEPIQEITEADIILLESFYATLERGLSLVLHKG